MRRLDVALGPLQLALQSRNTWRARAAVRCFEVFLSLLRGPGRIAKVGIPGERAIAIVRGSRSASRYAPVAVGLACTVVRVFQCRIWVRCGTRGYTGWRMPGENNEYKQNKLIVSLWLAVVQTANPNINKNVKGSKMNIELAEPQTVACSVKHNGTTATINQ